MGLKKKIKSSDKPSKKRKMVPKPKVAAEPVDTKDLAEQDLDEFLKGWGKDDSESDNENRDEDQDFTQKESNNMFKKLKKVESSEDEGESSEEDVEANKKSQRKYIKSLNKKDPEFLAYLKEQGAQGILDAEESDSSGDEDNVHKPPSKLEVDSDESDYEFEGEDLGEGDEQENNDEMTVVKQEKITNKMLSKWTTGLTAGKVAPKIIYDVVEAFRAAVSFINEEDVGHGQPSKYKVKDSTTFNYVIRMCVLYINGAIRNVLGLKEKTELAKPRTSKKFARLKFINRYLENLCVLVSKVSEQQVSLILIKHTYHMVPYFQGYGKGEKILMQGVIRCWSEGADPVKVVALLCIVRMAKYMPELLEPVIAKMHLSYVRNSKFCSPSIIPNIHFMRRSLIEVYGLDHKLAYYQAFLQIRQLAIHLRTALIDNTPQHIQAVYNWQFIRSIELWGALVGSCSSSEIIRELIYPLVQIIFGAIRLVKGNRFLPLKFHCATLLTQISAETGTFIPVLPVYLDILNNTNLKKRPKKASMKPMDLSCILKVSKSERQNSGFNDALIEQCYAGCLTYLAHNSNKVGFPELVTPMIIQLKAFVKDVTFGNYSKMFKQIIEKTVSNQKFIEEKRRGVNFGVGDLKEIDIWETKINRDGGTPLLTFYTTWKKSADTRTMMRIASEVRVDGQYDVVPQQKKSVKRAADYEKEMEEGFLDGSDDDDDIDDEERFKVKEGVQRPVGEAGDYGDFDDDVASLKSEDYDALEEGDKKNDDDSEAGEEFEMDSQDDSSGEENSGGEDSDEGDAEDTGDKVKDLKLEDFDASSESETELKDDFGEGSDDESDLTDQDDADSD